MFDNIKGVGPKKREALKRLGINHEKELLFLIPNRYQDKRKVYELSQGPLDARTVFKLQILSKSKTFYIKSRPITKIKAKDESPCEITYFNDRFSPQKLRVGETYLFFAKLEKKKDKYYLNNPEIIGQDPKALRIEPIYPLVKGLYQKEVQSFVSQALDIYNKVDFLDNTGIKRQDINETFKFLHRPKSFKEINLAFEDLIYRKGLLNIFSLEYIKKYNQKVEKLNFTDEKLDRFIAGLDFDLTDDQKKVLGEIASDIRNPEKNMNRLLQGDVGSGKTVVAIGAAVLLSEYQSAFLAPTEVLARQHYVNYKDSLKNLGIKTGLLTGSMSGKEKSELKEKLKNGQVDLVFGTHALIQDDVKFKKLALIITDEQHKFGVYQRNSLVRKSFSPNILVMSATPIPRTLAISRYGNLDISSIKTKPKGRKEIETFAVNMDYEKRIFDFIEKEAQKGNSTYIVCPSISVQEDNSMESVEAVYKRFRKCKKDIPCDFLHGQMSDDDKGRALEKFSKGKTKVLVSTTVIEVGIDVASASLMVIYDAERFGLAQLHQLRGRVGRSNIDSYCILICGSNSKNTRERMKIMCESTDGFYIAEKDLQMRGPGEILGKLQSGELNIFDDLSANSEVLELAYENTRKVLEEDPFLDKDSNQGILQEVEKIIENTSGYSLN